MICKASSEKEGWTKSTKAMEVAPAEGHTREFRGCVVQVTTQQRNIDGTYALAEAITFVPYCEIAEDENGVRRIVSSYRL